MVKHTKIICFVSNCVLVRLICARFWCYCLYAAICLDAVIIFCCYFHSYSERGVVDIMMCTGAHFWPRFPLNWLIVAQSGPARVLRNPISNWEEQILPESQISNTNTLQRQEIQIQISAEWSKRPADKSSLNSNFKTRSH